VEVEAISGKQRLFGVDAAALLVTAFDDGSAQSRQSPLWPAPITTAS